MLSEHQKTFFQVFGYLKLPGLFREDMPAITEAFETVFAQAAANEEMVVTHDPLHGGDKRCIVPAITGKHPLLGQLNNDERIAGIARDLIGPDYRSINDDGSLFYCDSNWHPDIYGAPLSIFHVKISLYLDRLTEDSGAIRVIPGSQFHNETYAKTLRKLLNDEPMPMGMPSHEIPSQVLESEPGDVVVWSFRTIHGSYFGGERRRLLSLNFAEALD